MTDSLEIQKRSERIMRNRVWVSGMILIAMYLALGGNALARYPHASFTGHPDACAACHRVHTATAGNLIKDPTGTSLCYSCHWGGLGADTDVKNGQYVSTGENENTWGDPSMPLLGGGFAQVNGTSTTTSHHVMDTPMIPPGVNDYQDPGAAITLKCMSCHSAHPDKGYPNQYRLLRVWPNGIAKNDPREVKWNGPWDDASQTTKDNPARDYRAYTDKDWNADLPGTQVYTMNYGDGMSQWCVSCHTKYLTSKDSSPYDAGDAYGALVRYRHHADTKITNLVDATSGLGYNLHTDLPLAHVTDPGIPEADRNKMNCVTCHRSHGTDTVMVGSAILSPTQRVSLPTDSTLLRRDNRGVCGNCHTNI